jgi:ankyrin repeat protein
MGSNIKTTAVNRSKEFSAALRLAARAGDTPKVEALLASGADIHDNDDVALLLASLAGHAHTVRFLMSRGARLGAWAEVALLVAEHNQQSEIAQLLAAEMALVKIKR